MIGFFYIQLLGVLIIFWHSLTASESSKVDAGVGGRGWEEWVGVRERLGKSGNVYNDQNYVGHKEV